MKKWFKCILGIHSFNKWFAYTAGAKIAICDNCGDKILGLDETYKNGISKLIDWSKYKTK